MARQEDSPTQEDEAKRRLSFSDLATQEEHEALPGVSLPDVATQKPRIIVPDLDMQKEHEREPTGSSTTELLIDEGDAYGEGDPDEGIRQACNRCTSDPEVQQRLEQATRHQATMEAALRAAGRLSRRLRSLSGLPESKSDEPCSLVGMIHSCDDCLNSVEVLMQMMQSQIESSSQTADERQTQLAAANAEVEVWKKKEAVCATQLADKQAQLDVLKSVVRDVSKQAEVRCVDKQSEAIFVQKQAQSGASDATQKKTVQSGKLAQKHALLLASIEQMQETLGKKSPQDASNVDAAELNEKIAQMHGVNASIDEKIAELNDVNASLARMQAQLDDSDVKAQVAEKHAQEDVSNAKVENFDEKMVELNRVKGSISQMQVELDEVKAQLCRHAQLDDCNAEALEIDEKFADMHSGVHIEDRLQDQLARYQSQLDASDRIFEKRVLPGIKRIDKAQDDVDLGIEKRKPQVAQVDLGIEMRKPQVAQLADKGGAGKNKNLQNTLTALDHWMEAKRSTPQVGSMSEVPEDINFTFPPSAMLVENTIATV